MSGGPVRLLFNTRLINVQHVVTFSGAERQHICCILPVSIIRLLFTLSHVQITGSIWYQGNSFLTLRSLSDIFMLVNYVSWVSIRSFLEASKLT